MLMPKRVKRRRVHRGSMAGKAQKGNTVTYGEFGLVALEASWITSNQIEAARNSYDKINKKRREGLDKNIPTQTSNKKTSRNSYGGWERFSRNTGWLLLSQEELCLN